MRRTQVEREMEAELADHLERETKELIALGLPPAEARRRASTTMGRIDSIKDEIRIDAGQGFAHAPFYVRLIAGRPDHDVV